MIFHVCFCCFITDSSLHLMLFLLFIIYLQTVIGQRGRAWQCVSQLTAGHFLWLKQDDCFHSSSPRRSVFMITIHQHRGCFNAETLSSVWTRSSLDVLESGGVMCVVCVWCVFMLDTVWPACSVRVHREWTRKGWGEQARYWRRVSSCKHSKSEPGTDLFLHVGGRLSAMSDRLLRRWRDKKERDTEWWTWSVCLCSCVHSARFHASTCYFGTQTISKLGMGRLRKADSETRPLFMVRLTKI